MKRVMVVAKLLLGVELLLCSEEVVAQYRAPNIGRVLTGERFGGPVVARPLTQRVQVLPMRPLTTTAPRCTAVQGTNLSHEHLWTQVCKPPKALAGSEIDLIPESSQIVDVLPMSVNPLISFEERDGAHFVVPEASSYSYWIGAGDNGGNGGDTGGDSSGNGNNGYTGGDDSGDGDGNNDDNQEASGPSPIPSGGGTPPPAWARTLYVDLDDDDDDGEELRRIAAELMRQTLSEYVR